MMRLIVIIGRYSKTLLSIFLVELISTHPFHRILTEFQEKPPCLCLPQTTPC